MKIHAWDFLAQSYVQNHHQRKSNSEENRTNVGMFTFGHFRDQFFNYNI